MTHRYATTAVAVLAAGLLVGAAGAEAREPVARAAVLAAAQGFAGQSATGLEVLTHGAARIDRSRTSVGNYLSYGRFRKSVSFALFGTNTVDGETRSLWCIGTVEVVQRGNGRPRSAMNLTCPVG